MDDEARAEQMAADDRMLREMGFDWDFSPRRDAADEIAEAFSVAASAAEPGADLTALLQEAVRQHLLDKTVPEVALRPKHDAILVGEDGEPVEVWGGPKRITLIRDPDDWRVRQAPDLWVEHEAPDPEEEAADAADRFLDALGSALDARRNRGIQRAAASRRAIRRPAAGCPAPRARSRGVARRRSAGAGRRRTAAHARSDDPSGEPPRPAQDRVERLLARAGLRRDQVRSCSRCGAVAFAVDVFQREQLDRLGFPEGGPCPLCAREVDR